MSLLMRGSGLVEETVDGKNHQRPAGSFAALQRDDEAAEGGSRD